MTKPKGITVERRDLVITGFIYPRRDNGACRAEWITVSYTHHEGQLTYDKHGRLQPEWIALRGLRIKRDGTMSTRHVNQLYGRKQFEQGWSLGNAPQWAFEFAWHAVSPLFIVPDRLKD